MSRLGDSIKSVLQSGRRSSEAQRGEVDHRTPGSFPTEDYSVHDDVDQPHVGSKPVPSSGLQDLGGTSQDPGFITGHSKHNKEQIQHDEQDKNAPSSWTDRVQRITAGFPPGHSHRVTDSGVGVGNTEYSESNKGVATSPSQEPSNHNHSKLATDSHGRPDTSKVPGTGTTAVGAGGLVASDLGRDRSGQKADTDGGDTHKGDSSVNKDTSRPQHEEDITRRVPQSNTASIGRGDDNSGDSTRGNDTTNTDSTGTRLGTGSTKHDLITNPRGSGIPSAAGRVDATTDQSGASSTQLTSHSSSVAAIGAGTLAPHDETHNKDLTGKEAPTAKSTKPYWGDLPKGGWVNVPKGAGVYNTVRGHGSDEATSFQHRDVSRAGKEPEGTRTGPSRQPLGYGSGGVYNTVTGHGSHRDDHPDRKADTLGELPFSATVPTGYSTTKGAYGPHKSNLTSAAGPRVDADRDNHDTGSTIIGLPSGTTGTTGNPDFNLEGNHSQYNTDNRLGEGAAALGAGAAIIGATEHNKHPKEFDSPTRAVGPSTAQYATSSGVPISTDKSQDVSRSISDSHHQTEQAGAKATRSKQSSILTHHPKDKSDESAHHNSKLLGFLHRHKNEKHAGREATDTTTSPHNDPSGLNRGVAGLTGIGAAGAAGYGASHLGQDHQEQNSAGVHDSMRISSQPTAATGISRSTAEPVSTNTTSSYTDSNHTGNAGREATSLAGLGIGAGEGSGVTRGTKQYGTSSTTGTYDSKTSQVDATASRGISGDSTSYGQDSSFNQGYTAAGLTGAGAAGYAASRLAKHHNEPSIGQLLSSQGAGLESSTKTQDQSLGGTSGNSSGVVRETRGDGEPSSQLQFASNASGQAPYNKLADGTPSGVAVETGGQGLSRYGGQTGIDHSSAKSTGSGSYGGHHSAYNILSSGTPSGIRLDDSATPRSFADPLATAATGMQSSCGPSPSAARTGVVLGGSTSGVGARADKSHD